MTSHLERIFCGATVEPNTGYLLLNPLSSWEPHWLGFLSTCSREPLKLPDTSEPGMMLVQGPGCWHPCIVGINNPDLQKLSKTTNTPSVEEKTSLSGEGTASEKNGHTSALMSKSSKNWETEKTLKIEMFLSSQRFTQNRVSQSLLEDVIKESWHLLITCHSLRPWHVLDTPSHKRGNRDCYYPSLTDGETEAKQSRPPCAGFQNWCGWVQ